MSGAPRHQGDDVTEEAAAPTDESVQRHALASVWASVVIANFAALGPHPTLADMDRAARAARALVYGDEVTR